MVVLLKIHLQLVKIQNDSLLFCFYRTLENICAKQFYFEFLLLESAAADLNPKCLSIDVKSSSRFSQLAGDESQHYFHKSVCLQADLSVKALRLRVDEKLLLMCVLSPLR